MGTKRTPRPKGAAGDPAAGGPAGIPVEDPGDDLDSAEQDAYWEAHYQAAPYVDRSREYTYYQPAYRFGWESYSRYGRRSFDEIDEQLMRDWDGWRGPSLQTWREARAAARDAWLRAAARTGAGGRAPRRGAKARPPRRSR